MKVIQIALGATLLLGAAGVSASCPQPTHVVTSLKVRVTCAERWQSAYDAAHHGFRWVSYEIPNPAERPGLSPEYPAVEEGAPELYQRLISAYEEQGYHLSRMSPRTYREGGEFFADKVFLYRDQAQRWARLESSVSGLAARYGGAMVVAGASPGADVSLESPRWTRAEKKLLDHLSLRPIYVPGAVYKAVYLPSVGKGVAFWLGNKPGGEPELISIAELESRTDLTLFPSIDPKLQALAKGDALFEAISGGYVDAGQLL